jgi:hypothetical protein
VRNAVILAHNFVLTFSRGGMKESGIGRENGVEAYLACVFLLFFCFEIH